MNTNHNVNQSAILLKLADLACAVESTARGYKGHCKTVARRVDAARDMIHGALRMLARGELDSAEASIRNAKVFAEAAEDARRALSAKALV